MQTKARMRRGTSRWALSVLPWVLLTAGVVGCAAREMAWKRRMDAIREVQQLLAGVSRAPDVEAERQAVRHVAQWIMAEGIAVSISAHNRISGESIPLADIAGRTGSETAFEIGFDIDRDQTPEHTYQVCLKVPQHIGLLMNE